MESAESCLVVCDFSAWLWLHPVPSVPRWGCARAGRAAASGKEPGNGGQGARDAAGSGGGGPGKGFGTEAVHWLNPGCGACAALFPPSRGASARQLWLGGMGRGSGHGADGQNPTFPTAFPPDLR